MQVDQNINEYKSMLKLKHKTLIIEKIAPRHINLGWLKWVNDEDNIKTLNSKKSKYTKRELLKYLKNVKKRKEIMFAVRIKDNNEYIGNIKINNID